MDIAKITARLQREAKKSPGKAATLGVITVIAVWFWLPLVSGWFSSGSGVESVAAPAQPPTAPLAAPANTASNKAEAQPEVSWTQVWQWLQSDPLMSPADGDAPIADPFFVAKKQTEEDLEDDEANVEELRDPVDFTPQGLGMQLKSTIVGPRGGVASIDGRAYAEGEVIVKQTATEQIVFQLVRIDERSVVLVRDGLQYELKLPRSDLAAALGLH